MLGGSAKASAPADASAPSPASVSSVAAEDVAPLLAGTLLEGCAVRCGDPHPARSENARGQEGGVRATSQELLGARTVSTGQGAVRTTFSATLPSSACASPRRPWVPITTSPAWVSVAAAAISLQAAP